MPGCMKKYPRWVSYANKWIGFCADTKLFQYSINHHVMYGFLLAYSLRAYSINYMYIYIYIYIIYNVQCTMYNV